MSAKLRWTHPYAGFYRLEGSDYGVASAHKTDGDGYYLSAMEWALVYASGGVESANDGEALEWFDTAREAKEEATRRAVRDATKRSQYANVATVKEIRHYRPDDSFVYGYVLVMRQGTHSNEISRPVFRHERDAQAIADAINAATKL